MLRHRRGSVWRDTSRCWENDLVSAGLRETSPTERVCVPLFTSSVGTAPEMICALASPVSSRYQAARTVFDAPFMSRSATVSSNDRPRMSGSA